MGLSDLSVAQLAAFVTASCEAQGLPLHVQDPASLRTVAKLLGGMPAEGGEQARSAVAPSAGDRLDPPGGLDALRIKRPCPGLAGQDHGMVENGAHDRVLPVEVEGLPLGA